MPTPTIPAGNLFMNATIYTGDNTTPKSITNGVAGQAFQPDFVWLKSRSNAYQHNLYDSVRGAGSAYALSSDQTAAEGGNSSTYGYLSAFNSNGFAVTQGTAGSGGAPNGNAYTNQTSTTYVGWQWKAGGTAVTNTSGTVTSSVSANTTSGFSVVTYTGTGATATVGHGLGVTPSVVIVKCRANTNSWRVYFAGITANNQSLILNSTSALQTDGTACWSGNTSSVIGLGSNTDTNQSSQTFVAYCWSQIAGYSAFGSYTGNGSADGPFVYTGFRPRFVMIKRTDSSTNGDWRMMDSARDTYNVSQYTLYANLSLAEDTVAIQDFLSNGFKLRTTTNGYNGSGATYIYMAFCENPFKFANAR